MVLELGCAPGSWTQYISEKIQAKESNISNSGRGGKVIGIDLMEVEPIKGAIVYQCDAFSDELKTILEKEKVKNFDVIVSDMAPNTSGIFDVDQYASVELNLKALDICREYLKPNGIGVFKIFRGADFDDFWGEAKQVFPNIKTYKPEATRERSFEIYCVGKKK